jgi:hypothetical protein
MKKLYVQNTKKALYYNQEQYMAKTKAVKKPNFDSVWAALQEVSVMQKEIAEQQKETDRIVKNNAREIGKLGGRFGEMIEYMVVPNLLAKFHEIGFVFEKAYQQTSIKDKKNNIFAEIDITLENGDKVMIVEVKSKPTTEDIIDHIERMEKVRAHSDFHNDKRKYLGAIAGMVFNDNVKTFAMKNGFYIIEPSGDTFIITAPEGVYSPREW